MSWIDQKARADAKREVAQQQQRAWIMLKHELIRAHWTQVWREIVTALRSGVDRYNAKSPSRPVQSLYFELINPEQVRVRRDADTLGLITLDAEAAATGITAELSPSGYVEQYPFDMTDGERIGVRIDHRVCAPHEVADKLLSLLL